MLGLLSDAQQRFTPLRVAGCRLWLAADRVAGLADGASVATWPDLSGNGHDAGQADPARKPTYRLGVVNGKPVVRFDGADDGLECALGALNPPLTLFVVGYWRSLNQPAGDYDYLLAIGQDAAFSHLGIGRYKGGDANSDRYYCWTGGAGIYYGPVLAGQVWGIYSAMHGTAVPRHRLWLNGAAQVVDDYGADLALNGALKIGWATYGNYGNVDIAEIIIYSRGLAEGERRMVEAYLGRKYGIAV